MKRKIIRRLLAPLAVLGVALGFTVGCESHSVGYHCQLAQNNLVALYGQPILLRDAWRGDRLDHCVFYPTPDGAILARVNIDNEKIDYTIGVPI